MEDVLLVFQSAKPPISLFYQIYHRTDLRDFCGVTSTEQYSNGTVPCISLCHHCSTEESAEPNKGLVQLR